MLQYIQPLIFLLFFVIVSILLYRHLFGSKVNFNELKSNSYINRNDTSGQNIYEQAKLTKINNVIKANLETSWQFLQEIKELVLAKFSDKDKVILKELGVLLFQAGMRYNHVIGYISKDKVSNLDLTKKTVQNISK